MNLLFVLSLFEIARLQCRNIFKNVQFHRIFFNSREKFKLTTFDSFKISYLALISWLFSQIFHSEGCDNVTWFDMLLLIQMIATNYYCTCVVVFGAVVSSVRIDFLVLSWQSRQIEVQIPLILMKPCSHMQP